MDKEQLLNQAEECLKLMVLKDLNGQEKVLMNRAVEDFFREEVTDYSPSEILGNFITPTDALNRFMAYLNGRIVNRFCTDICENSEDSVCVPV